MDILDALRPYAQYWPLAVVTFSLMLVGKVSAAVFHRGRANWMWWGHKTLTLQPLVWGTLTGLVFELMPNTSVLAGIGCGVASVFMYQVLKGLLKQRGIDLDLPGLDGPNDDA
jgi:hypothetical protein